MPNKFSFFFRELSKQSSNHFSHVFPSFYFCWKSLGGCGTVRSIHLFLFICLSWWNRVKVVIDVNEGYLRFLCKFSDFLQKMFKYANFSCIPKQSWELKSNRNSCHRKLVFFFYFSWLLSFNLYFLFRSLCSNLFFFQSIPVLLHLGSILV